MAEPWRPRRPSRTTRIAARGLDLAVRLWGEAASPPLVMLHGGADASITFQFLVDALGNDRFVVAPDLRGHGASGWSAAGYAFADYLLDLDALLARLFPDRAVPLIGHSLGGNIACVYAGVRPERVSHLVSLDGFGLTDRSPSEAPDHLRRLLDAWSAAPALAVYASRDALAARLTKANPRLDPARALVLAAHLGQELEGGRWTWAFDPAHRRPFATMFRAAEFSACLSRIRAPTLFIGSDAPFPPALADEPGGLPARLTHVQHHRFERIAGAGHNLHHDEPERVARLVENFLEVAGA